NHLNHRHLGSMGALDSHFSYSGVHPSLTFGDFCRSGDPLSALSLSLVDYLLRNGRWFLTRRGGRGISGGRHRLFPDHPQHDLSSDRGAADRPKSSNCAVAIDLGRLWTHIESAAGAAGLVFSDRRQHGHRTCGDRRGIARSLPHFAFGAMAGIFQSEASECAAISFQQPEGCKHPLCDRGSHRRVRRRQRRSWPPHHHRQYRVADFNVVCLAVQLVDTWIFTIWLCHPGGARLHAVGEVAIGIGITVADSTTVHSPYRRRAKSCALKIVPCGACTDASAYAVSWTPLSPAMMCRGMARRSAASTNRNRTTPKTVRARMPGNSSLLSMLPFATMRRYPGPASPPTNSPTTAPTPASVIDIFSPPKIAGRAFGSRNLKKAAVAPKPMERAK